MSTTPSSSPPASDLLTQQRLWLAVLDAKPLQLQGLMQVLGWPDDHDIRDLQWVDTQGRTPLMYSAKKGFYECAYLLLQARVDVNYRNSNNGGTALHEAVHEKIDRMVKLLLENGASPFIENNSSLTPWDNAILTSYTFAINYMKRLADFEGVVLMKVWAAGLLRRWKPRYVVLTSHINLGTMRNLPQLWIFSSQNPDVPKARLDLYRSTVIPTGNSSATLRLHEAHPHPGSDVIAEANRCGGLCIYLKELKESDSTGASRSKFPELLRALSQASHGPVVTAPPQPQPAPAPLPQPDPQPQPQPAPAPLPQPLPAPLPQPSPAPQPAPEPQPQPAPAPLPQPAPEPPRPKSPEPTAPPLSNNAELATAEDAARTASEAATKAEAALKEKEQSTKELSSQVAAEQSERDQAAALREAEEQRHRQTAHMDQMEPEHAQTMLLDFCASGEAEVAADLLVQGADAKKADEEGVTPLSIACLAGHLRVVEVLLKAGAPVNVVDHRGSTPLSLARDRGHHHVVEALLKVRPQPISEAGIRGHQRLLGLFYQQMVGGAGEDEEDAQVDVPPTLTHVEQAVVESSGSVRHSEVQLPEQTVRHCEVQLPEQTVRHCEVREPEQKPREDARGKQDRAHTISEAGKRGHQRLLGLFYRQMAEGAGLDGSCPAGQGDNSLVDTSSVLESGSNPQVVLPPQDPHERTGGELLHDAQVMLYAASSTEDAEFVQRLLDQGADAQKADEWGKTPLLRACESGCLPVARSLLQSGARIDKANYCGMSPLFFCCSRGNLPLVKEMLDHSEGSLENASFAGVSAADEARKKNHTEIVHLLEQYEARQPACTAEAGDSDAQKRQEALRVKQDEVQRQMHSRDELEHAVQETAHVQEHNNTEEVQARLNRQVLELDRANDQLKLLQQQLRDMPLYSSESPFEPDPNSLCDSRVRLPPNPGVRFLRSRQPACAPDGDAAQNSPTLTGTPSECTTPAQVHAGSSSDSLHTSSTHSPSMRAMPAQGGLSSSSNCLHTSGTHSPSMHAMPTVPVQGYVGSSSSSNCVHASGTIPSMHTMPAQGGSGSHSTFNSTFNPTATTVQDSTRPPQFFQPQHASMPDWHPEVPQWTLGNEGAPSWYLLGANDSCALPYPPPPLQPASVSAWHPTLPHWSQGYEGAPSCYVPTAQYSSAPPPPSPPQPASMPAWRPDVHQWPQGHDGARAWGLPTAQYSSAPSAPLHPSPSFQPASMPSAHYSSAPSAPLHPSPSVQAASMPAWCLDVPRRLLLGEPPTWARPGPCDGEEKKAMLEALVAERDLVSMKIEFYKRHMQREQAVEKAWHWYLRNCGAFTESVREEQEVQLMQSTPSTSQATSAVPSVSEGTRNLSTLDSDSTASDQFNEVEGFNDRALPDRELRQSRAAIRMQMWNCRDQRLDKVQQVLFQQLKMNHQGESDEKQH